MLNGLNSAIFISESIVNMLKGLFPHEKNETKKFKKYNANDFSFTEFTKDKTF